MKKGFYILLCLFFATATSSVSFATAAEPKAYGIENVNLHPPSLAVNIDNFTISAIHINIPVFPAQTLIACDKAITDTPVKGYASVVEVNTARRISEREGYKNSYSTGWDNKTCRRNGRNPRDGISCTETKSNTGSKV